MSLQPSTTATRTGWKNDKGIVWHVVSLDGGWGRICRWEFTSFGLRSRKPAIIATRWVDVVDTYEACVDVLAEMAARNGWERVEWEVT